MKVMSLFSGIGGFELALTKLGHEIVGACEIDEYARRVYREHFPKVHIYPDACKIIAEDLPDFDLLTAGFPCQTFSVAGKRLGFEESRGTLFFEIARIAKQKRPRLLLLENVKGLLNHDGGRTFAEILATLDELGYDAEWQVLNSKYFVPQNRERIFIIGHLRGKGGRQIFPLGDLDEEANGKARIKMLLNHDHDTNRLYSTEGIARTLRANSGGMGSKTGLYAMVNDRGTPRKVDKSMAIDANYWKGMDKHGQRTMVAVPKETVPQDERVYGTDGISPSLRAGNAMSKPKILVPDKDKKVVKVIGNRNPSGNGQNGNVYSSDGLAPTLCSGGSNPNRKRDVGYNSGYIAIPVQTPDRANKKQNGRQIKEPGDEMFTLTAQNPHGVMIKENDISTPNKPKYKQKWTNGRGRQNDRVYDIKQPAPAIQASSTSEKLKIEVGITEKDGRKISNSIRVGGRGSNDRHAWDIVNDKTRIRRLTPTECERLQGFPDGWTEGLSDTQRYKCCGNAVTVPVVEYIAKNLI